MLTVLYKNISLRYGGGVVEKLVDNVEKSMFSRGGFWDLPFFPREKDEYPAEYPPGKGDGFRVMSPIKTALFFCNFGEKISKSSKGVLSGRGLHGSEKKFLLKFNKIIPVWFSSGGKY